MRQLKGRVAVVTGAASGIGLSIAAALAGEGVQVVMSDIDGDAAAVAAASIAAGGGQVEAAQLDVRDPDAVEAAAEWMTRRFGAVHIAVNNAGILRRGLAWEISLKDWEHVLRVNLWGVINGIRSFVPRILDTGEDGHVVNIASMAAVLPQERLGPYAVAKHAVLGLSDILREDLKAIDAPVGVSVVLPGRIRTSMNPIGSVEPSTVAENVLDAITHQRAYVYTDDHASAAVNDRLSAILAARADVITR